MTAPEPDQHAEHSITISTFTTALAVTIIKSKPSHLTLRDYIARVYSTLSGRQKEASSSVQAERLNEQLRSKDEQINTLREENDLLKAALSVPIDAAASQLHVEEHERSWQGAVLEANKDQDMRSHAMLRYMYLAHRFMTNGQCDYVQIGCCLHQLITNVSHVLYEHRQEHILATNGSNANHQTLFSACARAMTFAYRGVESMSGSNSQRKVIFAAVQLYSDLVSSLDEASVTYFHNDMTGCQSPERLESFLSALTGFLIYLIDELKPELEPHRKLFEGYMFILVAYTGRQIYPAVFGHARGPSVEAEIRAGGHSINGNTQDSTAVPIRTSCLIQLLKHSVRKAPSFFDESPGLQAASSLRNRLQHTLVEAIFGHGSDNAIKVPTLQLPAVGINTGEPVLKQQALTCSEWLIQEVWSVIGWDVLAQPGMV